MFEAAAERGTPMMMIMMLVVYVLKRVYNITYIEQRQETNQNFRTEALFKHNIRYKTKHRRKTRLDDGLIDSRSP